MFEGMRDWYGMQSVFRKLVWSAPDRSDFCSHRQSHESVLAVQRTPKTNFFFESKSLSHGGIANNVLTRCISRLLILLMSLFDFRLQ